MNFPQICEEKDCGQWPLWIQIVNQIIPGRPFWLHNYRKFTILDGMESKQNSRKFLAWPFWVADGLLLCWAAIVWIQNKETPSLAATSFYILAVGLAFVCGVAPVLLEKWYTERERRRLLNQEFQEKVALALGEVLDRLDRMERSAATAPSSAPIQKQVQALIDQTEKNSSRQEGELAKLLASVESLKEQVAAREEVVGRLIEELKEEKKKLARRGVSGILYPEHTQASWVARGNQGGKAEKEGKQEQAAEEEKGSPDDPEAVALSSPGVLEVQVLALIGIGNKPFLRGDIPGLSKEQGVPMEFVEIGKWRWKGTLPAEQSGELEVWLNDAQPARENPIAVDRPYIEIRPVF